MNHIAVQQHYHLPVTIGNSPEASIFPLMLASFISRHHNDEQCHQQNPDALSDVRAGSAQSWLGGAAALPDRDTKGTSQPGQRKKMTR